MKQIRGYRPIKDSERFRVRYACSHRNRFHKRLVNRGQLLDKIFILSNGIWNERFFETSKFLLWDKKITRFFVRIHFKKFWQTLDKKQWDTRPTLVRSSSSKAVQKNGECGEERWIANSAWPFATVRGPGFAGRVCVACARSVNSHTEFFRPCNNACDAVSRALVRALRV